MVYTLFFYGHMKSHVVNIHYSWYFSKHAYFIISVTYGSKAKWRARFTAVATFLWNFKEVPVSLRGKILPCSFKNFLKKTGHIVPVFDSGWNENKTTSFFFEAKVYYSQLYVYWMEKIRLYSLLRVIVKKITNK